MEALDIVPVWVRDFGVFATFAIFSLYLLRFSPFAFRITGEYKFVIGRNGSLEQIAKVSEDDHEDH